MASKQQFGGDWTSEKLERVRKYLSAYAKIMHKQKFKFAYIDAFAGTGYNTTKGRGSDGASLLPELTATETIQFVDGSARIALKIEPRFDKYIFVERSAGRFAELEKLKEEFPHLKDDIILKHADANSYLQELCEKRKWQKNRAVLFLDPFGMQVTWRTMTAIANTKAIDLWLLFPSGIGVNRMLTKDAKISVAWQKRLDDFFGTTDWREAFYSTTQEKDLFGDETSVSVKTANFQSISRFFLKRLETIFAGVAKNPLELRNSVNTPLYMLFFAAGNERGASTAVKIAQDILKT
jgi:three-Cys-motif partner protein